jgi:hypothetical protein
VTAPFACEDCLHSLGAHTADGCTARDESGNRCACIQDGYR